MGCGEDLEGAEFGEAHGGGDGAREGEEVVVDALEGGDGGEEFGGGGEVEDVGGVVGEFGA